MTKNITSCVIHIGMHKTGSTAIQTSLNNCSNENFFYPDIGGSNHSIAIYSIFSDRPDLHMFHLRDNRSGESLQHYIDGKKQLLKSAVQQASGRTLVISGEDIGSLKFSELLKLRDFLLDHTNDLRIFGYVRPPAGFISSAFQQRLKGGKALKINLGHEYCNYEGRFEKFDRAFGRDKVFLRKFDPMVFPSGCVVRDFCSMTGLDFPEKQIKRANESVTRSAASLLFIYHRFARMHGYDILKDPETQRLANALSALGGGSFRFSPDIVIPVLEKNRHDIKWMEERLGQSLAEDLGAHQTGDVRNEEDLLRINPRTVAALLAQLGEYAPIGVAGDTPEEVAKLVHALRCNLQSTKRGQIMRIEPTVVAGWAIGASPLQPLSVVLLVNGKEIGCTLANLPRPAIKARGLHPTGECGFSFTLDADQFLHPDDQVVVKDLEGDLLLPIPFSSRRFK